MKKKDLEKRLGKLGWRLLRHGGKHDYWTNGEIHVAIPRHKEANEILAQKVLKKAKKKRFRDRILLNRIAIHCGFQ